MLMDLVVLLKTALCHHGPLSVFLLLHLTKFDMKGEGE